MKIVLPEYVEILSREHIRKLKRLGDVTIYPDIPETDDEIIKRIKNAELIAVKWVKINSQVIDNCPNLKYIIALSTGINSLDIKKSTEKGIKIINCPTHNARAVAEHIIGLMLAVSRHIPQAQLLIQKGKWKKSPYMFGGVELSGKKLGLIGYGQIGKQVEKLVKGLGMNVSKADSKTSANDLDDLIKTSDYISLSLPYTVKTHHLIDKRRLGFMKKTAYLINTARGEIIDQKILVSFLKENKVAGAALDVFENEPINTNPPDDIVELANLPNVVATPHIAFNTKEAAKRLGEEFLRNVRSCIQDKPINLKN